MNFQLDTNQTKSSKEKARQTRMLLVQETTLKLTEDINIDSVYQFINGVTSAVAQQMSLSRDAVQAVYNELEEAFVNEPDNWVTYSQDFDNYDGKDFAIDLIDGEKVVITQFFQ